MAIIVASLGLASCSLCEELSHGSYPSPSGTYVARVFQVDCGAAGGPYEEIQLSDQRWWLKWRKDVVFKMIGFDPVSVEWHSNEDLHVRAPPAHVHEPAPGQPGTFTTNIYAKNERWHDVRVSYEFAPRPFPNDSGIQRLGRPDAGIE